jgi:hypothetical protein
MILRGEVKDGGIEMCFLERWAKGGTEELIYIFVRSYLFQYAYKNTLSLVYGFIV